jgi:hypothetical protein
MAERPITLPLIDRLATNLVDWAASPLQYTGYQPGQVIPSAAHNTTGLLGALWNGYLDYGTVRASDYLDTATTQRWSTTRLAYGLGGDVLGAGGNASTFATYFVGGYRIEIDDGLLRPVGAAPLIQAGATLPGRIWLYLDYGIIDDPAQPIASIRVDTAAAGAAATPGAGELALVGVDVNALGIITGNTYDGADPAPLLVYNTLSQAFSGDVIVGGVFVVAGDLDVGGALSVDGLTTLNAGLSMNSSSISDANDIGCETVSANGNIAAGGDMSCVNLATGGNITCGGNLDMDAGNITNAFTIACTSFNTTSDITCGGNLDMTSGSISNVTTLGTSGLATINQLSVTTTSSFTGIISPLAGVNLGAQQIAGIANSIVDVDRVLVDRIEFTDMAAVYSTTGGHLRWNTTALMFAQSTSLGDAVAIDDPQRGFDLAFSSVNPIDTTTAVASRRVQQAEPVWIETTCRFEGTSAASAMNYRLQIAGPATIDVDIQTFHIATINVGYSMTHVFLWVPTDDFAVPGTRDYIFTVRLGRSAGTLTCANVSIKVSSALEI